MPYRQHKIKLTPAQQKKAMNGAAIRVPADCIGTGQIVMLHPLNYRKVVNAKGGINLELSPGEMMQTAVHHGLIQGIPNDLNGAGIFDSIWSGLKSAGKWLKDSGVGSALADVAQDVATPFVGPEIAQAGRSILKSTTGVGLFEKPRSRKKNSLRRKSMGSGLYI
jgi:hypothetical protein